MMLRRRRQRIFYDTSTDRRRPVGLWLLEAVIVGLIGLNVYLFYGAVQPTSFPEKAFEKNPAPPDPALAHVQVEILTGVRADGVGQQALNYLRKQGFDVVNLENAEHFNFAETVILDRRGDKEISPAALSVARALGTPNVILQRNDDRMVDVTAVIGGDYKRLFFSEE
jgi:hypothetical protein